MKHPYGYKGHTGVLNVLPSEKLRYLWYIIAIICTPFIIKTIIDHNYVLMVSLMLLLTSSSIYLYYLIQKKTPPISLYIPLVSMCLTQCFAVYYAGVQAIFWSYPAIVYCYFVVTIRNATILAILITTLSGIFLYGHLGLLITLRYVFSVIIVCVLVRIMVNFVLSLKEELITLSTIDPLTGAYNRRHMDEQLNINFHTKPVVTLLLIDIDHFKRVNDTYGHDEGDNILQLLVACLKENSRKNDLIFRMGGEEFVMLLPDTNKDQAIVYANFLRNQLASIVIGDSGENITVSIGASELSTQESSQNWLKQADIYLYQAKAQGRNQVVG